MPFSISRNRHWDPERRKKQRFFDLGEMGFEYLNTFSEADPARKALVFLKAGISAFTKKNYRGEPTLKVIVAALMQAPLLIPAEVDFDELLGGTQTRRVVSESGTASEERKQADLGNGTTW